MVLIIKITFTFYQLVYFFGAHYMTVSHSSTEILTT